MHLFFALALLFVFDHAGTSVADFTETVDDVHFLMKAIPGGEFSMGCGIEDEPCAAQSMAGLVGLRQRVAVEPFYLAATETTWDLYQLCIEAKACPDNEVYGGDNGWGKGDRPVIEVSWNDVSDHFLKWLQERTGRPYRFPTEAEWEYAARAGTTSRFSWGPTIDCTNARYGYETRECGDEGSTLPVASFAPNAFGLYDMHGNVWEFVQDCWSRRATSECEETVLRGGSWLNSSLYLGSAARFRHDRNFRESGDGFRLALDLN